MKTICVFVVVLASVAAEPPRYRNARFQFQRQEEKRSEAEPTTARGEEPPYPASGFRPAKEFNLPSRQEAPPATSYGVPADSYGAPLNVYSVPEKEYGVPRKQGEEGEEDAEEAAGLKVEGLGEKKDEGEEKENEESVINQQGAYYVLLPDAQLQRVQFQTENDIRNMAYTARLQYRNEDRAPVYVYSSAPAYQRAAYIQLL